MQCDEFDVRWQQLLDLRRTPQRDLQLRRHARHCAHCAARLAASARLFQGLDAWEIPPLPDDFARRVVQQVAPAHATPQTRRIPLVLAVAAAVLLVALPGLTYFLRSRGSSDSDQSLSPTRTGQVAYATSGPPRDLPRTFDHSPWTLYGHSILGLYPEETRERHRQRVSEFAEDLRPIASPFNAALTAIRRTIPVNRSSDKHPPNASATPVPAGSPAHA